MAAVCLDPTPNPLFPACILEFDWPRVTRRCPKRRGFSKAKELVLLISLGQEGVPFHCTDMEPRKCRMVDDCCREGYVGFRVGREEGRFGGETLKICLGWGLTIWVRSWGSATTTPFLDVMGSLGSLDCRGKCRLCHSDTLQPTCSSPRDLHQSMKPLEACTEAHCRKTLLTISPPPRPQPQPRMRSAEVVLGIPELGYSSHDSQGSWGGELCGYLLSYNSKSPCSCNMPRLTCPSVSAETPNLELYMVLWRQTAKGKEGSIKGKTLSSYSLKRRTAASFRGAQALSRLWRGSLPLPAAGPKRRGGEPREWRA